MRFRTEVSIQPAEFSIDHGSKVMMIGSCFSENIGSKLKEYRFDTQINPFGILFNPISISNGLHFILKRKEYHKKDLFLFNDLWHSYDHHGTFSSPDDNVVLEKINSSIQLAHQQLINADCLFITLGSAWHYRHLKANRVVANCHKVPGREFDKRLFSTTEIVNHFADFFNSIKEVNENLKIVFSVSPVRHWKDGAVENQRSKSILNLAAHEFVRKYDFVSYFEAYELMMDDLRDYRFYNEDLLHPTDQAVNYIWGKFQQAFFLDRTKDCVLAMDSILKSMHHKPFHPGVESEKKFQENLAQKKKAFEEKYGIALEKLPQ